MTTRLSDPHLDTRTAVTDSWTPVGAILAHRRVASDDRRDGRVTFAQVREDPSVDEAIVDPTGRHHVVVVTSGGCTALTMVAAGAGRVTAVDVSPAQNHLAELKAAALASLSHPDALAFLGAMPAGLGLRRLLYRRVRSRLSPSARRYWDRHQRTLARGALGSGTTERFLVPIAWLLRTVVLPRGTVDALIDARDSAAQSAVFHDRWDTWRWRAMFALLLNRRTCRRVYGTFFDNIDATDFAAHFRSLLEPALRDTPAAGNWYLHELFRHRYRTECLPPHLRADSASTIAANLGRLTLVDDELARWLGTQADGSVDAFCLSNIGEWLDDDQRTELFAQIARTATDDAVVVLRNFIERPVDAIVPEPHRSAFRPIPVPTDIVDHSLVRYQVVAWRVRRPTT